MIIVNTESFARYCRTFRAAISTSKRRELFDAMVGKLTEADGAWEFIPTYGLTICWKQALDTPEYYREPHYGLPPQWDLPTYENLVFLTLSSPTARPILGTCRGPGAGRRDQLVSLARALDALANPEKVLELC
jgi:hypothetical protein